MNKKEMNNKGFSLVELIIVIAIMAILVGVLAPQFIKYVESSRQSTDISAVSEYKTAVESWVADEGTKSGVTVPATINVVVSANGVYATVNLTDVGLAESSTSGVTPLKSSGWTAATVGSYDTNTFQWTATNNTNSKAPKKDLADAFR
ncbi:MAG: prepilin-type N-terminal cleavage/methylation domain-containing protein [Lachnospiraceae bacterium]|nr:prepilin-type N-terminal cleavage/methylation domain-containing protein [Lachnospiraceae bacterium]